MLSTNDGGPVLPEVHKVKRPNSNKTRLQRVPGMRLRDYFAANAPTPPDDFGWASGETDTWHRRARWAFVYADAMLAAREA